MAALSRPVLAASDRGTIRRCPCCGDPQVVFDGACLTLTARELQTVHDALETARAEADVLGAGFGWALRTGSARRHAPAAPLELDGAGVGALDELVAQALAVLDLDALLLNRWAPRPVA